jgi:hypothetical protein
MQRLAFSRAQNFFEASRTFRSSEEVDLTPLFSFELNQSTRRVS